MRFMLTLVLTAVVMARLTTTACAQEPVSLKVAAPEVRGIEAWINSKPLTLKELRGNVVVLHFWTFG